MDLKFHILQLSDKELDKPNKLNYPFNYFPHPWAIKAAEELKQYIQYSEEISHDSRVNQQYEGYVAGKMFGVLVCENLQGEIGFLAAFSGKLDGKNLYDYFVPPVFDILDPTGFFLSEMEEVNQLTAAVKVAKENAETNKQKAKLEAKIASIETDIANRKKQLQASKNARDAVRATLSAKDETTETCLRAESALEHIDFKHFKQKKLQKIEALKSEIVALNEPLKLLKEKRAKRSNQLQLKVFQQFSFLNAKGERRDLHQLFSEDLGFLPPAGAGECAGPKLFQYAYLHQLKPLTMAEFWWGQSPKSEIRQHGRFYPACKGKCEPILSHMTQGLEVEENPMLVRLRQKSQEIKQLEIVYEDDFVVAVNKPEGFLSVPGKIYKDSVLTRLQAMYPQATGPLLIHRLDMSTSGILLAGKTKEMHEALQKQFLSHSIVKRYDAILDGILEQENGEISLPLRVDLDDRPRQLVDFKHGKPAKTRFEKIKTQGNLTWVHFWPISGRTHQLRVHASHSLGLNLPILGDDLYGKVAQRLFLHAGYLEFFHPIKKERITLELAAHFEKWMSK